MTGKLTDLEKLKRKLANNRIISYIIILATVIAFAAKFSDDITKIFQLRSSKSKGQDTLGVSIDRQVNVNSGGKVGTINMGDNIVDTISKPIK